MKKLIWGILIFFIPMMVKAAEVKVTDFLVDAKILENGDMEVEELISAEGSFNWYERDLVFKNNILEDNGTFYNNSIYNATDIELQEIKAKEVKEVSFDTFKEDFNSFTYTSIGNNGDKAKYTESNIGNGYRYRLYYYTNNSKTAFYIKYVVKDAVVLHNDIAELYWTFVPDGFEEDLHNIKIRVSLPNDDNTENLKYWAHGNLSGEINKINNKTILASIKDVFEGEAVDVRLTFDKSLVQDVVKNSYVNALDEIVKVETERAEVANNLRKELNLKRNFVIGGTIMMYVAIVVLTIYIYLKYGKSPKSGYYSKYNREFIDDYNVEVVDYLMNRKITSNAMSASIMNLIYKKNIKAEELADTKDKKVKQYMFTLENSDNINQSEQILIDFLFDKVGKCNVSSDGKKIFTTKDLKSYATGTKTCSSFVNNYTDWKNSVISLGEKENFYVSSGTPKVIGIIVLILSFLIFSYGLGIGIDFIPTLLLIFLAAIFFIYSLVVIKKSERGAEHYDKWKAFRNFLDDFGTFELKELPEVILWERYLVYATVFGLASKVQKSMNVMIKEVDMNTYQYYPSFIYFDIGPSISSSINNAISSAYQSQAANYANTHSSSSSGGGFGGGFSSGGGFGGGGGGGRFG